MEKRKTYDRNFKVMAVQLESERGFRKVSRELDIAPSLILRWQREFRKFGTESFCGSGRLRNPEQKRFYDPKRKLEKKLKELELYIEIFKNGSNYLSQGKLIIYRFIDDNTNKYPLRKMCKVLGISHSSYCKWKNQVISPRQRQTILLEEKITSIFFEYKELYGAPKITAELQSRGFKIKKTRVSFYMKKLGLISKIRRDYTRKSDLRHNHYVFPNLLNRQMNIEEPCQAWLSGITRIHTEKGALYLTVIMDLFNSNIVGWSVSNVLTAKDTTIPAWEKAIDNLKIKKKLIFHSDRAVQFANKMFSDKLDSCKYIRRSMSRKGSHCNNAISESFFRSIKSSLIGSNMLLKEKETKEKIFEYIENWQNKEKSILF